MARLIALALALHACSVAGFLGGGSQRANRAQVVMMGGRAATPLGRVSLKEGKLLKIDDLKERLEASTMVFSLPSIGLTMKEMTALRDSMPEDTTISIAKNKLMQKALSQAEGYDSVDASTLLKNENMWFFCGDDLKGVMKGLDAWVTPEDNGVDYKIRGGISAGAVLDSAGVVAISKLPSRIELLGQVAFLINEAGAQGIAKKINSAKGMPQGLAKRLKEAAGNKMARAVKLGTDANCA